MRRALLIATALAVAASAPAGAAKKAYFRLDVEASQHVKWSDDSLTKGCSDSVLELHAKGTGDLEAQDHNDPWAVAQRPGALKTLAVVHRQHPRVAHRGRQGPSAPTRWWCSEASAISGSRTARWPRDRQEESEGSA